MKRMLLPLVLLAAPLTSFGQTPLELSLGDTGEEYSTTATAVFNNAGDHLFIVSGRTVRIFATHDGSLVREYVLPVNAHLVRGVDTNASQYSASQVALAFGGKNLIVIFGDEAVLLDVQDLISKQDISSNRIRWPTADDYLPLHFICSLSDDRLAFVAHDDKHGERLALVRMGDDQVDTGSIVDLETDASSTPNFLSGAGVGNRRTYLVGPSPDGTAITGLRVIPDAKISAFSQLVGCKAEKIKISWDERGYGKVQVEESLRLPTLPVSVSPNLKDFMIWELSPSSGSLYQVTIGISAFGNTRAQLPVRRIIGEDGRPTGRAGLWCEDGSRFFVNDGFVSTKKRPRSISVHDPSGSRIAELPLGAGLSAEVLATSRDGRFVLTKNVLNRRTHTKKAANGKRKSVEFSLWDLR